MIRKHVDILAVAAVLVTISLLSNARRIAIIPPLGTKAVVMERGSKCFIVRAVSALRVTE